MNIDKSRLKSGLWYEDEDGNYIPYECVNEIPEGAKTYHVKFPLEVREELYVIEDRSDCKHPMKYRKKYIGDEYWHEECGRCGKVRATKKYIPLMFGKWKHGDNMFKVCTFTTHIGSGSQDTIIGMVQSGEYSLSEAIAVYANACERCANALTWRYTQGKDGYPEYSDEYKNCHTRCDYCKEEQA